MRFKAKKRWLIAATLILLLSLGFFLAPPFILKRLNHYLADFSPAASIHINTLEIPLWRAAYRFGGITLQSKKDSKVFCKIEDIDISLAWRELLRLKIRTDIAATAVDMFVDKNIYALAESGGRESGEKFSASKKDAVEVKNKLFPIEVARLGLLRSSFYFADKLGLPFEEQVHLTEIQATITQLTPIDADEASHIWASGLFMDAAKIKIAATAYLKEKPKEWDVDLELRALPLRSMNGFLKRIGPLTFNAGSMDLFFEAKSEKGQISGYAKPFLSQVDIVGNKKDFMGVKHFFVETFASLAELIFISSDTETISTKIPISQKGSQVTVDKEKALAGVLRHAFKKEYTPQIEDSITLTKEKK